MEQQVVQEARLHQLLQPPSISNPQRREALPVYKKNLKEIRKQISKVLEGRTYQTTASGLPKFNDLNIAHCINVLESKEVFEVEEKLIKAFKQVREYHFFYYEEYKQAALELKFLVEVKK